MRDIERFPPIAHQEFTAYTTATGPHTADFSIDDTLRIMREFKAKSDKLRNEGGQLFCHPDNKQWLLDALAKSKHDFAGLEVRVSEWLSKVDDDGELCAWHIRPPALREMPYRYPVMPTAGDRHVVTWIDGKSHLGLKPKPPKTETFREDSDP